LQGKKIQDIYRTFQKKNTGHLQDTFFTVKIIIYNPIINALDITVVRSILRNLITPPGRRLAMSRVTNS